MSRSVEKHDGLFVSVMTNRSDELVMELTRSLGKEKNGRFNYRLDDEFFTYADAITLLLGISKKFPASQLEIRYVYGGTCRHAPRYLRNGHYVRGDNTVRPKGNFSVQITSTTKEALTAALPEIYLRLRAYDFAGNFGVDVENRLNKTLTRTDKRKMAKAISPDGLSATFKKFGYMSLRYFNIMLRDLAVQYGDLQFEYSKSEIIYARRKKLPNTVKVLYTTQYRAG